MPSETKTAAEINREINEALDQRIALNEAVARAMGWNSRPTFVMGASPMMGRPDDVYETAWTPPEGVGTRDFDDLPDLPDFAADPHALGYMVEWLMAQKSPAGTSVEWHLGNGNNVGDPPFCAWLSVLCLDHVPPRMRQGLNLFEANAHTPGQALALAIVAYAAALKEADRAK